MGLRERVVTGDYIVEAQLAAAAERAKEAAIAVEAKIERALTCVWEDLPSWQQDNHFIRSGYRYASNSFLVSIHSLTYLHNETVNIYSHLLGSILSILIASYIHSTFPPRYPTSTLSDKLAFLSFFLGAFVCLGMSATYHLISNHSPAVARLGNRLDYIGIVAMIAGSYVSCLYYGFWCLGGLRRAYCGMILFLGLLCTLVTLHPHFRTPAFRPLRAAMYVSYGLSGVIPILHGVSLLEFAALSRQVALPCMVLQGVLYISGAVIYAARVPERWRPGKFDIVGHSHQVFHVLVLAAAGAHLVGLVKAFDYRHSEAGLRC